jgi:hypothetical protein
VSNVNWMAGVALCWFPLAIAPALAELTPEQANQISSLESVESTGLTGSNSDLAISETVSFETAEAGAISQVEVPPSTPIAHTMTLPPPGQAADLEISGEVAENSLRAITSFDPETAATAYTTGLPEIEAIAQTSPSQTRSEPSESPNLDRSNAIEPLNLDPETLENSPVLQRWLEEIPNVLSEIRSDPSFRTRLRLGYSQFPSTNQAGGFNVGIEDVFIGQTGLTVSADYQATFEGDRQAYGVDLRYYVRPLGSYINVAPVIGYRHLETDEYTAADINLGLRFLLALSRTGAADISLTQTWVAPGRDEEVGITTLSVGYAITENLRLSTDIQKQNSSFNKDSRVGIVLEWML